MVLYVPSMTFVARSAPAGTTSTVVRSQCDVKLLSRFPGNGQPSSPACKDFERANRDAEGMPPVDRGLFTAYGLIMDLVTRVVALVLLLACAGQAAVDTLWCPDGCREAPVQQTTDSHHRSAAGVCLFCGTGFVVTAPGLPEAPTTERPQTLSTSSDSIPSPNVHAIDHPPRLS